MSLSLGFGQRDAVCLKGKGEPSGGFFTLFPNSSGLRTFMRVLARLARHLTARKEGGQKESVLLSIRAGLSSPAGSYLQAPSPFLLAANVMVPGQVLVPNRRILWFNRQSSDGASELWDIMCNLPVLLTGHIHIRCHLSCVCNFHTGLA